MYCALQTEFTNILGCMISDDGGVNAHAHFMVPFIAGVSALFQGIRHEQHSGTYCLYSMRFWLFVNDRVGKV